MRLSVTGAVMKQRRVSRPILSSLSLLLLTPPPTFPVICATASALPATAQNTPRKITPTFPTRSASLIRPPNIFR